MRRVCFAPFTLCAVLTALLLVGPLPLAHAISYTGDVSPSLPWTSGTYGYVGNTGTGTLTVDPTASLSSNYCQIGYSSGANGTVYVTGNGTAGSATWTNTANIIDGNAGQGAIDISNGGLVNNNATSSASPVFMVGYSSGGVGSLTVDGSGSVLNCLNGPAYMAYYAPGAGNPGSSATVTISNGGVANFNWVSLASGGTGSASDSGSITVTGAGSALNCSNATNGLALGYVGSAQVNVTNGGKISVLSGNIGLGSGSYTSGTSTLNVDGQNSLYSTLKSNGTGGTGNKIGTACAATVNITGGGTVKTAGGLLNVGAYGTVNIDGSGSQWLHTASAPGVFNISGTMNISGGGAVSVGAASLSVNNLLSIDVGRGSSLSASSGSTLTNNAILRVVAGAGVPFDSVMPANNVYTPITNVTTWNDTGTDQALGGTWNSGTEQFTVASAVTGTAGSPTSLNTSTNQRMLISDSVAGTSVGVGLLSTEGAVSLTASTANTSSLDVPVLDAWTFSGVSGVGTSDPAYLSLSIPAAVSAYSAEFARTNLSVWSNSGSGWAPLTANDLTFDPTSSYASFTVTGNGSQDALTGVSYAISSTVILPGDANLDGRVDINDLTIVLANYNHTGTWATGDFNGDSKVDINDLTIVLAHYDTSVGLSAAGMSAVPEPGTLLLLAASLAGLLAYAWRK